MQHAGRIDPQRAATATVGGASEAAGGYPVRLSSGTAYWTVDGVQWSNLGAGLPREGQVYRGGGRAFIYRNGKMHAADGAAALSSGERCPGGQCPRR